MVRNSRAFTLIEIIVVVAITLILTGISLAYYNQYSEQKKLETEAEKFVDVLNLARNKAISGEENPCSVYAGPNKAFGGHRVRYADGDKYLLRICCTTLCTESGAIQTLNTYNFPTNISLKPDSYANVWFIPLYGSLSDKTITHTVLIKSSVITNKCYQITIEPSGLVKSEIITVGC